MIYRALNYYVNSTTIQKVHSPFLYSFVIDVIENRVDPPCLEFIEEIRESLAGSKEYIPWVDLGAKSRLSGAPKAVKNIVQKISISHNRGRWLYKTVQFLRAKNILELGTCLGMSSIYLAASDEVKLTTVEGQSLLFEKAKEIFVQLKMGNIESHHADIFEFFAERSSQAPKFDLVFVDAMHSKRQLLKLCPLIDKHTTVESCIIFDDINWSSDMQDFWREYSSNHDCGAFVDLFFWGIHFKNPSFLQKKELCLIPRKFKPYIVVP